MEIRITKSDIIWSYLGKVFQIASGLFLLPLILSELTDYQVGIWYIFLSITALVNLIDFGMQPSIMRNISYIYSGARELVKEGTSTNRGVTVDYRLLVTFIKSVKNLYKILAIISFILLSTLGTMYIHNINSNINLVGIELIWLIYSFSTVLNLYFYYYTPLLTGQGKIKESNKSLVYSKFIYIIFSFILLKLGFGLLAVAISNVIGAIANRYLSHIYLYDVDFKRSIDNIPAKFDFELLKIIWHNSKKMGVISVSYFLMTRASTLLVGKYLPITTVASYGLTIQLFDVLVTVSTMLVVIFSPKLNMLSFRDKDSEFKVYSGLMIATSLSFFMIGAIVLIIFGDKILNVFSANVKLLNQYQMGIIALYLFLGINFSIICQIISSKNIIPYEKSSFLSGIGIITLTFLSLKYTNYNVYGVVISPLIIQSIYNYWKWPMFFMSEYNTSYSELFKLGFKAVISKLKGED